jgi:hypothetical protein
MTVPKLDVFLAATMRPSEDLTARLAEHGIPDSALSEARARARGYGFGDPRNPTRALLEIMFGVPTVVGHERLTYELVLWPEHEFRWRIESNGDASHEGFALKALSGVPTWTPRDPEALRTVLKPWYHTGYEVRALVGEPELDLSWGAAWGWHYSYDDGSRDIVFDFDYGLLRDIRVEGAAPRDSPL